MNLGYFRLAALDGFKYLGYFFRIVFRREKLLRCYAETVLNAYFLALFCKAFGGGVNYRRRFFDAVSFGGEAFRSRRAAARR